MRRFIKTTLFLLPALALAVAALWFFTRTPRVDNDGDPASAEGGRLVVLVVFDQMRGDYLEKWQPHFSEGGFEKLKREGTWYSRVTLPYANTATGPGHASIVSGAPPSVHGILENSWFDRGKGKLVSSSSADEGNLRVPASRDTLPGLAPTRILAPTLSDALKAGTNGKGRLFSFSLKDRAAVMMGGKDPAGVYCFDNATGEFHTSTYYRDRLPGWVEQFNKENIASKWGNQSWDRFAKTLDYDKAAGPDAQPGEYGRIITLPRPLPPADSGGLYYSALEYTPYGNELLWEFAKAALAAEKLGTRGTTDVLCLSFSSNDLIGHMHGPDSHEVLDVTLRSDALLGTIIKHLDDTVGKDKFSLVVTSDHGISPLPEVAVRTHPEAARILYSDLVNGLEAALDDTYGKPDGLPGAWVEADFKATRPWIFLNRRLIETTGVPYTEIEGFARKWLANRPDALTAFSRTQLLDNAAKWVSKEDCPYYDAVRLAFHYERSGDICIVQKPFQQLTGRTGLGVDHGSVHDYDRQVFILAYGARVPKLAKQDTPASSLIVAPLLAKLAGVNPPEQAKEPLPPGW